MSGGVDDRARSARTAGVSVLLIIMVATMLRPALTSVGPLLPTVGADEGLGETALGLFGALPLVAFGLVSPLVHRWSGRLGVERTVLVALLLLAAGCVIRSYGGPTGLWVGTMTVGGAIAVGNVLVPAIIRRDHTAHVSRTTAIFSAAMVTAAGVASAVAVPIGTRTDWRFALAVWALPAAVIAVIWWFGTRRVTAPEAHADDDRPAPPESVWRLPMAWLVTAYMGVQSTSFYVLVNWLPTIEAAAGIPLEVAGIHLLVYQVVGVPAGMLIPLIMRGSNQIPAGIIAAAPILVAAIGLMLAPTLALLWIVCVGLGSGMSLVVALSLIGLRSRHKDETARLSGMAQSLGYGFAAFGPLVAGLLAERTGGWDATLMLIAGLAIVQILIAVPVGRERSVASVD